jgi:hypothetical protein
MSAGQVWRRADGLLWVELQTAAIDGSGWRLMAPLVDRADAPDAPPLIVTVDRWRARLHLLTGAPERVLGELPASCSTRPTEPARQPPAAPDGRPAGHRPVAAAA